VRTLRVLDQNELEERAVAIARALRETQQAFDGVASTYDRSNSECRTLCEMRQRTLAAVVRSVPLGARLLDLGCGPGADAEQMARAGYAVTAIDWSPAMAGEAAGRARRAGLEGRIDVKHLGIHELDRLTPDRFDGAWSNLGPLNCVPSLEDAAALIAERLRPGGVLVASVIGRICPWEIALFASRGDWRRIGVRFARGAVSVPLEGHTVWTRYYTPRAFTRAFKAAGFRRVELRALGLCVPPPYAQAFADRHPALVSRLQAVDDAIGAWPIARGFGDHFLIVLRKR
jgi:SAM-dependent methyltransferase